MSEIRVSYEGDLRCKAEVSGKEGFVITDAPDVLNGRGETFSPGDLIAASLGSCILTTMGAAASYRKLSLAGLSVKVEKIMGRDPAGAIKALSIDVHMPVRFDDKNRHILENSAKACPVSKIIDERVTKTIRFHYPPAE